MRVSKTIGDELATRLQAYGFTRLAPTKNVLRFRGVTVRMQWCPDYDGSPYVSLVISNRLIGDTYNHGGSKRLYSVDFLHNAVLKMVEANEKLLYRREKIAKEIIAYCEERRVPVSCQEFDTPSASLRFFLKGWEHSLFNIVYHRELKKFYVNIADPSVEFLTAEDTDDDEEYYAWVENGNDVAEQAAKKFGPNPCVQTKNVIQTLENPAMWLHWMFTYGFDKLGTLEVRTYRQSDDIVINALIDEEMEEHTLYTLEFIDDLPSHKEVHAAQKEAWHANSLPARCNSRQYVTWAEATPAPSEKED